MIEGTEVDRCSASHGLWFDNGELSNLRNNEAATGLEVGEQLGQESPTVASYMVEIDACSSDRVAPVSPPATIGMFLAMHRVLIRFTTPESRESRYLEIYNDVQLNGCAESYSFRKKFWSNRRGK